MKNFTYDPYPNHIIKKNISVNIFCELKLIRALEGEHQI